MLLAGLSLSLITFLFNLSVVTLVAITAATLRSCKLYHHRHKIMSCVKKKKQGGTQRTHMENVISCSLNDTTVAASQHL